MTKLTLNALLSEARTFYLNSLDIPDLFGATDGKAVGTFVEQRFKNVLKAKYEVEIGNSAMGIDLPGLEIETDIKVTSHRQPQSSCPFKDAYQKIYGLGYNLLVFVYDKKDDLKRRSAIIDFTTVVLIEKARTADYTTTYRLREMIADGANTEDIAAYLMDRNIPLDETKLFQLAEQILHRPPEQGYLTISNALQWRLQYGRVLGLSNPVAGINGYSK